MQDMSPWIIISDQSSSTLILVFVSTTNTPNGHAAGAMFNLLATDN